MTNSAPATATYNLPGGITGTASKIDVALQGHPDNLFTRTYVNASSWSEGLSIATEDCVSTNCTGTDRKRWTYTNWTQDDTTKTYIVNPRVTESRVGDGTNTKRTSVEYYPVSTGSPVALYGLVKNVFVYDADLTTVLKRAYTEYNLDSAYTSRRIIGLPSRSEAWGKNDATQTLEYVSKMTYAYDEGNFSDTSLSQNISPVQHDNLGFGASFISGRANLNSTTRYDVTGQTANVSQSVKYNTAGAVVSQTTPWDGTNTRTVKIGYADNFNTTGNPTTYAYPTVLTDPAGSGLGDPAHSSTVKYRYDIGANVWAKSPAPALQSTGKETTREFDSLGRALKETIVNTGAYTRYEYPTNGVQSKVFSTIIDTNNNGADIADEVLSESWADGAGRSLRSRTEHPNSVGGWSGTIAEYDILGRAKRQSVPTEVSVPNANNPDTWAPAGDDATRGWTWNYQYYDWKGRTTRTVPSDSTGSTAKTL